ncbi:hypothetical protein [Geomonas paludis]|uniref:hypothetical protein n=1 Tax=Geomonas paludis TaxID=2740185 RepID=UPI00161C33EE|nr:hypothetical protein [Geomonas paludis]
MSDGPHRSLPLRRHWKKVAELASKPAFSVGDVAALLRAALVKDLSSNVLKQLQKILNGLFAEDCKAQLEEVRNQCRGSAMDNLLIDCAIEANTLGLTGDLACIAAVENSLQQYFLGVSRQVVEHYLRRAPAFPVDMRKRLAEVGECASLPDLSKRILSGNGINPRSFSIQKQTGIDEGPPL